MTTAIDVSNLLKRSTSSFQKNYGNRHITCCFIYVQKITMMLNTKILMVDCRHCNLWTDKSCCRFMIRPKSTSIKYFDDILTMGG